MYVWHSNAFVSECAFLESTCTGSGGSGGALVLQGGRDAAFCAGQTGCGHASLVVTNSLFQNNVASTYGGAVYAFGDSTASVAGSQFVGNRAGTQGGAVAVRIGEARGSALVFVGSSFTANSASSCGAVSVLGSVQASFQDSVVAGNTAAGDGGGICFLPDSLDTHVCVNGLTLTLTQPLGDIAVVSNGQIMPTAVSLACGWSIVTTAGCLVELDLVSVESNSVISVQSPYEAVKVVDSATARFLIFSPTYTNPSRSRHSLPTGTTCLSEGSGEMCTRNL